MPELGTADRKQACKKKKNTRDYIVSLSSSTVDKLLSEHSTYRMDRQGYMNVEWGLVVGKASTGP
jgi:hypothetical protein